MEPCDCCITADMAAKPAAASSALATVDSGVPPSAPHPHESMTNDTIAKLRRMFELHDICTVLDVNEQVPILSRRGTHESDNVLSS